VNGTELYDIAADPGQDRDIAVEHPNVVQEMRRHYESWWTRVEPGLEEFESIVVGSEQENPTRLSSLDWLADKLVPAALPFDIRQLGVPVVEGSLPLGRPMPLMNGPWNIQIARPGTYRIMLRRWPEEADAAITAPLPAYQGVDGVYPPGKALPAARARLRVGVVDLSKPIAAGDKAAVFTTDLPAGPAELKTWFYNVDGDELCGAFFVQVERM
jgi:hypothetical protein